MSSGDRRPHRRLSIGAVVGAMLAAALILAAILFWLAQGTVPSTSPQTDGSPGAMAVVLAPGLI